MCCRCCCVILLLNRFYANSKQPNFIVLSSSFISLNCAALFHISFSLSSRFFSQTNFSVHFRNSLLLLFRESVHCTPHDKCYYTQPKKYYVTWTKTPFFLVASLLFFSYCIFFFLLLLLFCYCFTENGKKNLNYFAHTRKKREICEIVAIAERNNNRNQRIQYVELCACVVLFCCG